MKTVVMSVGGSIIVPDNVDYNFIKKFKSLVLKHKNKKFVIVVGGGSTARKYIKPLAEEKINEKLQCLIGIGITRLNARFLANFFGKVASQHIPSSMKELKNLLMKHRIVFAGGLRFIPNNTSDGTAAAVAHFLKTDLINMTNVKGLFDKDPRKFKNAKFISKISLKDFYKMANKIKYKPGQHFVLDQHASEIIKKNRIKTVILSNNLENFENYLKCKKFVGTVIS